MSLDTQIGLVPEFKATRQTGWQTIKFPKPFGDKITPVVMAQIQSRNGGDTPGLRIQNVTNTSFDVRIEELIGTSVSSSVVGDLGVLKTSGFHRSETLGWIAVGEM